MRTSQSLLLFSTFLIYLITLTAAWPWPMDKMFPAVDSLIVREAFMKRADSSGTDSSSSIASTPASAASSAANTDSATSLSDSKSTNSASASGSAPASGSAASGSATSGSAASGSDSRSGTITSTKTSGSSPSNKTITSTSISIGDNAAAGGLEILIPDTTSGSYFYKISDSVTFAWNYTSLSVTPTAIDVLVTCTSNSQMYTIAQNMSVSDNATGVVTWDTFNYPEQTDAPLLTAIYTLYIFDADSSISADPSAGHLSAMSYAFGMYTKTPYTPLASGWTCATCSGALSADERRALGFMLGMIGVTVLSFTWFVSGMGVIW